MKQIYLLITGLILLGTLQGQGVLNGIIYYQNSGGRTVAGVQVSAFGCNSQFSTSSGMFQLTCPTKQAGQKINLILGPKDLDGKNIEIVNQRELNWLRMPNGPDPDPIEIIVCYSGQREEAALRLYGILNSSTNKAFEQKLDLIQSQLDNIGVNVEERRNLMSEIDKLKSERDKALEKIEEQADFIAGINRDQASELVNLAINWIENEQDVTGALAILEEVKLDEAYATAEKKVFEGRQQIKQVIEGYKLRIQLLGSSFNFPEIIRCYQRVIEIHRTHKFDQDELAELLNDLGLEFQFDGRYEEALEVQLECLKIREAILEKKDPDLARIYNNIAITYEDLGMYEEAMYYSQKCIQLREEILEPNHPHLANTYGNVATLYEDLGKYDTAIMFHEKALTIRQEIFDSLHPSLGLSYANIAESYYQLGQFETTLAYEEKALNIREQVLDPKDPDLAIIYNNISLTYLNLGQKEKALEMSKKALAIREEILNPKHPSLGRVHDNISRIYSAHKDYANAIYHEKEALAIFETLYKPDDPRILFLSNRLGTYYDSNGDYHDAIEFYQRAVDIAETLQNYNVQSMVVLYDNLAFAMAKIEDWEGAMKYLVKCQEIRPDDQYVPLSWSRYYALKNHKEEALAFLQEAIDKGFNDLQWLTSHMSVDNIRNEVVFLDIVDKLKKGQEE